MINFWNFCGFFIIITLLFVNIYCFIYIVLLYVLFYLYCIIISIVLFILIYYFQYFEVNKDLRFTFVLLHVFLLYVYICLLFIYLLFAELRHIARWSNVIVARSSCTAHAILKPIHLLINSAKRWSRIMNMSA